MPVSSPPQKRFEESMGPMSFDEQLDLLEESMRKLKVQYDLYFAGVRKVPPSFERGRLDSMVHEMSRVKLRELATRFRFNTLLARYNQYRELWSRRAREAEEGPMDYRRRAAALKKERVVEPPESVEKKPRPRVTSKTADSYVQIGRNGGEKAVAQIYSRIVEAQRQAGQNGALSLEQVRSMVQTQAERLRDQFGVETIAFRVEVSEGKIKLKAKPIREGT